MDQEREVAMATLASALERAKMVKDASLAQTKAYEKVGTEQARLQDQDRRNKETAAQRDERKKRQQQSEARKMAAKLQADVDEAVKKYAAEMTEPWFGKPKPKHSKEDIAAFRADYAARLAKANRAILNRMQDVKVNEDDGTFEFTGDNDLADMGDAEVAKEQGALPQKPGMNPGENPGNNPSPGAGANAGGGTPQFGITGPIGDPNTKYYMIGDSGEVIYIPRSAYFKGIGKPDPQNSPDASSSRKRSGVGGLDADMGEDANQDAGTTEPGLGVDSSGSAASPRGAGVVNPTGGVLQDAAGTVVGALRGMVSNLQNDPTPEEMELVRSAMSSPEGRARLEAGFPALSTRDQERLRKAVSHVISSSVGPGVGSPSTTVQKTMPGALSGMGQAWQSMGGGSPSGGASPDVIAPVLAALPEVFSNSGAASGIGQAWQGMGSGMPTGGLSQDVVAPVVGALRGMYSKFRNEPTPEEVASVRAAASTPDGRARLLSGFGALSLRDQDRLRKAIEMAGVK